MGLTKQQVEQIVDDLLIDFPGMTRLDLQKAVHNIATEQGLGRPEQVGRSLRMRLSLQRQGDHGILP